MPALHEFHLPNVAVGLADLMTEASWQVEGEANPRTTSIRDRIEFCVAGIPWTLRRLVLWDDSLFPADVLFGKLIAEGRISEARSLTDHCVLQTPAQNLKQDEAESVATDIAWLLQLALGQRVKWTHYGVRDGEQFSVCRAVSVNVPEKPGHHRPISNYADGALKRFMENGFPAIQNDLVWWRITLDWFALAYDASVIQVTGLICSMLLERATRFLLKSHGFAKQIDESLTLRLKANSAERIALAETVTKFFREVTDQWSPQRTESLLNTIQNWNDEPSYGGKIKIAFEEYVGLESPPNRLLDNRSSLAHNGELKSGCNAGEYYAQITEIITALLLKMVGYTGKYYVLGVGEKQL